jgi:PAS domain S-box-containing protein
MRDITSGRRAQEALGASERRFRELLAALPAAVYTTDAAGRVTFYNQAAVELAGHPPEIGSDEQWITRRLYRPDGTPLPHDECPMAVTLKENRPVRGAEALAERPDGTRVPFIPYPTPLRDEIGELVGAVNMLVDISERKQAEANQKVLLDELNHRVKNNMQMLHSLLRAAQRETQSAQARAVLADASQRVGAMAAAQQVLYEAGNTITYSARDFLEGVCASARQAFTGNIDIVISDCAAEQLSNDTAMPLALILNELLTNAAKHGVNGRGEGSIKVRRPWPSCRGEACLAPTIEDQAPQCRPIPDVSLTYGWVLESHGWDLGVSQLPAFRPRRRDRLADCERLCPNPSASRQCLPLGICRDRKSERGCGRPQLPPRRRARNPPPRN